MKKVRRDVAHVWAHRLQEEARNASGSLYFRGDVIFSYGSHFPIARHVKMANGEAAVLFTLRDHSVTTAKHKGEVRAAIPNYLTIFYVYNVMETPGKGHLTEFRDRIATLTNAVAKSKPQSLPKKLSALEEVIEEANFFCESFGMKTRFSMPKNIEELREKAAQQAVKDAARERRAEAARERKLKEQYDKALLELPAWLSGISDHPPSPLKYAYMRIVGDEVHTTQHARVHVKDLRNVARAVLNYVRSGRVFVSNGLKIMIGPYPLREITAEGEVVVGCHRFQKEEIERIAALIGE